MKTTIDLPEDLLHQLKLRAVHEGRKLRDLAAEYLRNGLAMPSKDNRRAQPTVVKDKKTGLPVVQGGRPAPRHQPTPGQIAELLADQEIAWVNESA